MTTQAYQEKTTFSNQSNKLNKTSTLLGQSHKLNKTKDAQGQEDKLIKIWRATSNVFMYVYHLQISKI